MKREHRLEEEHADIEYQIRVLMSKAETLRTDDEKLSEERLIQVKIKNHSIFQLIIVSNFFFLAPHGNCCTTKRNCRLFGNGPFEGA